MGLFDGYSFGAPSGGLLGGLPPWMTLQSPGDSVLPPWLQAALQQPNATQGQGFPPQQEQPAALPPNAQQAGPAPMQMPMPEQRRSIWTPADAPDDSPPVNPNAPAYAMRGPMMGGAPQQPQQAPGMSAMAQAPQPAPSMPSMGNPISGFMDMLWGGGDKRAGTSAALAKLGIDPQIAQAMARDRNLMALAPSMLGKQQHRMLTVPERKAMGLPENLPWFVGPDGKPTLPEGMGMAKQEITKDANGNPIAVNPFTAQGAPVGGLGQSSPNMDAVSGIRKEVGALPEVKRYGEALPIFRSMIQSHNKDSAAADLDYVYGVAKIFDPDSVVREGEMKLVGSAQSLPEDIKGFIKRVVNGEGRLSPEARQRILEVANTRMQELKGSTDSRIEPYKGIAQRNNIRIEDILPGMQEYPQIPKPAVAPGATPTSAPPEPPKPGSIIDGYRFIGGNPADKKNYQKVQ